MVKIVRIGNLWQIIPDSKVTALVDKEQKIRNKSKVVLSLPNEALNIE